MKETKETRRRVVPNKPTPSREKLGKVTISGVALTAMLVNGRKAAVDEDGVILYRLTHIWSGPHISKTRFGFAYRVLKQSHLGQVRAVHIDRPIIGKV